MMSNIVDDFSFTMWYNSIMQDCVGAIVGAIPWGFSHAPRR